MLLGIAGHHHAVKLSLEQYVESAVPELSGRGAEIVRTMMAANGGFGPFAPPNSDD